VEYSTGYAGYSVDKKPQSNNQYFLFGVARKKASVRLSRISADEKQTNKSDHNHQYSQYQNFLIHEINCTGGGDA